MSELALRAGYFDITLAFGLLTVDTAYPPLRRDPLSKTT
jgi:hypothetical protein